MSEPRGPLRLPADLLSRSAEEAVRRLALVQLGRASAARLRLVEGDREEALHDFRVALRRLRSLLRSHRGSFSHEFPKKSLRRIAAIARDTNPGRDAEVQLAWVVTLAADLKPAERAGHAALARELTERRDECYRKVEREIVRDFSALATDFSARLRSYQVGVDLARPSRPQTFAAATRSALAQASSDCLEKLAALESAADESAGHAARIAAKRVRYLAEPVAPWIAAAELPIAHLKALQDLLGELHDGQLLAAHIAQSLAELEARRAQTLVAATLDASSAGKPTEPAARRRERAGLLAVARKLGERRNELFAELERDWLGTRAPVRTELVEALVVLDEALAIGRRRATPGSRKTSGKRR
ncbi:MAG: CHAD domain-containing protein [Thermoanaerobaculia bacterium]